MAGANASYMPLHADASLLACYRCCVAQLLREISSMNHLCSLSATNITLDSFPSSSDALHAHH